MEEGILGNVSDAKSEDIGNEELPQPLGLELGLLSSQFEDVSSGVYEREEGLFSTDGVTVGGLSCFHDIAESSSNAQGVMEVNLNLGLGDGPSSSAAALGREGLDGDSHNKRPKVHSFSL